MGYLSMTAQFATVAGPNRDGNESSFTLYLRAGWERGGNL
ncbi:hypothetical protein ACVIGB_009947 [Bradyrhizobium sp. USDA 4341]